MIYRLKSHPAVKKDLRHIAPDARDEILNKVLSKLEENPFLGMPLTGPLRGYWKYRVFLLRVWYRIGYSIDTEHHEMVVIAIGARGGFYQRLRRRLKK